MADTQVNPLGTVAAPADWVLPDAQILTLGALFAHFDGSGAAGAYLPTVQIISDSGHTVLEVAQTAVVLAGLSVEASWAPSLSDSTLGAAIPYHLVSAATTNATLVQAGATVLTDYYLVNTAASYRYVKLYDKATAPTVGTNTPVRTLGIPVASAANVTFVHPLQFVLGLGFGITVNPADNDATAVAVNDVIVNLGYI